MIGCKADRQFTLGTVPLKKARVDAKVLREDPLSRMGTEMHESIKVHGTAKRVHAGEAKRHGGKPKLFKGS